MKNIICAIAILLFAGSLRAFIPKMEKFEDRKDESAQITGAYDRPVVSLSECDGAPCLEISVFKKGELEGIVFDEMDTEKRGTLESIQIYTVTAEPVFGCKSKELVGYEITIMGCSKVNSALRIVYEKRLFRNIGEAPVKGEKVVPPHRLNVNEASVS